MGLRLRRNGYLGCLVGGHQRSGHVSGPLAQAEELCEKGAAPGSRGIPNRIFQAVVFVKAFRALGMREDDGL